MNGKLKAYFVSIILAAAAFLLLVVDWSVFVHFDLMEAVGLAVFIALATLSENLAMESGTGKRVRSSIAFIPLLAMIVHFPTAAVVAAVMVMWGAVGVRSAKKWQNVAFNVATMVLSYGLAAQVYAYFSGSPPGQGLGDSFADFLTAFLPFYGAVLVFFGTNVFLISLFIAIRDEQKLTHIVSEATGRGGGNFVYDLLASPIAFLVSYLYWQFGIAGLVLVVLPLLLIRATYFAALKLERANRDLLRVLIKAIETRDPYTSGHSLRVSTLAKVIAEDLGVRRSLINDIEHAALLHDIGKIDALYAEIISKDAELTEQERSIIRTHATKGADLLQSLTSLETEIVVGVRHHHERYDGTGYPDGLVGKAIPLAARIIMICDSVDAMLSDRPYRDALPVSYVREELKRCSGTQFDPDIVSSILAQNTLERAELLVDRSGARAPVRAVG